MDLAQPTPRAESALRTDTPPERLIRLEEVRRITGLSRSRIYELMDIGRFPASIPLGEGARAVGWIESEVRAWVARQIANARTAKAA